MADSIRINHAAAKALLQSPEVMRKLREVADRTVAATGKPDDYEIEEWVGVNRARVSVSTATHAARVKEATEHTLLQALNGATGGP